MTVEPRDRSRTLGIALVVLAIGVIAWLFLASPMFRISTIEVEGNARLTDDEVRTLVGNVDGESLVFLSTGGIVDRLERSPWVADASVVRSFPTKLLVRIRERIPVAVVEGAAGSFLISADGIVLGRGESSELPRLHELDVELSIGQELPSSLAPVRVLAALPASIRSRVSSAQEAAGEVTLQLRPRGVVRFGIPTDLRRRTQALAGVLLWADQRGVRFRYIDVRVPENPVLLPIGAPEPVHPPAGAQG